MHSFIHFNVILNNQHSNFCAIKISRELRKRKRQTLSMEEEDTEKSKNTIKHGCITKKNERKKQTRNKFKPLLNFGKGMSSATIA